MSANGWTDRHMQYEVRLSVLSYARNASIKLAETSVGSGQLCSSIISMIVAITVLHVFTHPCLKRRQNN